MTRHDCKTCGNEGMVEQEYTGYDDDGAYSYFQYVTCPRNCGN